MQDLIKKYETLLTSSKFLFIVYYRGHWCPFCTSYLATLQALSPSISAAGGKTVTITSEPEEHLVATRKSSGYQGEAIIDPENKLAKYFKERSLLDVAISEMKLRRYEFGMAQPAILVIGRDGAVLENWAIVPGMVCIIFLYHSLTYGIGKYFAVWLMERK
ncbi:hypothetical protein DL98DRAFT_521017 [Cadophora sp. DSE1049]|nr:hypothetical protein DL98DRAFT_521017 [Cadophora sp. DSE1049]